MLAVFLLAAAAAGAREAREPDLLEAARGWRAEAGLAAARDRLAEALLRAGAEGGSLEKRVLATNRDQGLTFRDSLAAIPPAARPRIGIFMVPGYIHKNSRSLPMIESATRELRDLGYHAKMVALPRRETVDADADALLAFLKAELPSVDRALLVGFSKGAGDISHMLLGHPGELPARDRAKLRVLITVAGVVRGSSFAEWMEGPGGWEAVLLKLFINLKTVMPAARFDDLRSLRDDPWAGARPGPRLRRHFPNLRWISYAVLPDGPDGSVHASAPFGWLSRTAARKLPGTGPNDGLAETAAGLPPPGVGLPLHVVRVWGSHATLDGRYANGSRVAPSYARRGAAGRGAGIEFLDDLMRAMPGAWVLAGEPLTPGRVLATTSATGNRR